MDVKDKMKLCGLLMFPTAPQSRNNTSIREVDSSSSAYESSRNMINNSLDHQFIIQDEFSNHALAAGAAAGGDFINQENLDTSNGTDADSSTKSQPKRIPRPPNAFILYRRAKQPAIIASQRNLTNAEVSRTISDMWKKEPEDTRLFWERYADRKKLEHMQTYPDYVYRPNKNKSKNDRRKQQRRQTASKDSSNNNNNNGDNNKSTTSPGPVRRKSMKNVNNKPPTKLDLPLPINGMTGFNMQQPMSQQVNSNNDPSNSYTTILPSPDPPFLSANFTENPEEFVSSNPISPTTPLTPPENDYKIQNNLLLTYQQQQQHHQGNAPQFFQPTLFPNQAVNPYICFVPDVEQHPDVEQQQQQFIAEMMLHHGQHHHITPATVPSSNPAQFYSNGGSFTEMLAGFEFQPFLSGSVSHNGNGLDASDHYLQ